jgi:hypothetical protein
MATGRHLTVLCPDQLTVSWHGKNRRYLQHAWTANDLDRGDCIWPAKGTTGASTTARLFAAASESELDEAVQHFSGLVFSWVRGANRHLAIGNLHNS